MFGKDLDLNLLAKGKLLMICLLDLFSFLWRLNFFEEEDDAVEVVEFKEVVEPFIELPILVVCW